MKLPERIHRLHELATDLWWTWNALAREVFRLLDYPLWRQTAHNRVLRLRNISAERLEQVAKDDTFLADDDAAIETLDRARSAPDTSWQHRFHASPAPN